MERYDREQGLDHHIEKPDYFVVDMESLFNCTDKDSPRMSRSLSRKGSQRCERKPTEREAVGSDGGGGGGGSSVADGLLKGGCTPEKSIVLNKPSMETTDSIVNSQMQPVIKTNGESRFRRYNKQRSTWIDPWRIVVIFATLSSIGSIILIYVTLSMSKLDGEGKN